MANVWWIFGKNGGFLEWGYPFIAGWFCKGKSHLEMDDDWGYAYFRKPPHGKISFLWLQRIIVLVGCKTTSTALGCPVFSVPSFNSMILGSSRSSWFINSMNTIVASIIVKTNLAIFWGPHFVTLVEKKMIYFDMIDISYIISSYIIYIYLYIYMYQQV